MPMQIRRAAALTALVAGLVAVSATAQAQSCGAALPAFQAAMKAGTAEALAGYIDAHAPCFEAPARARLDALGGAPAQARAAEPDRGPMAGALTIVSWGGTYQQSQVDAYATPYQAMHPGLQVTWETRSPEAVDRLRDTAKADSATWDLVDVYASDAITLCAEGLAMKIDHDRVLEAAPDGTPASSDFGDKIVNACFIPQIVYSTAFAFRTDVAGWNGRVPTTVCDLFDLKTFPGQRSLQKSPMNNMEWALYCDGVALRDIYDVLGTEAGQNRALAKLATIKASTTWWTYGRETPDWLAEGTVVIGSSYSNRLFDLIHDRKPPVAMLWDAQVFDLGGWIIPANLPADRLNRALDFVAYATAPQRLADQTRYTSFGPARASSAALVGRHERLGIDIAPHLPTAPANAANAILHGHAFWAENFDRLDAGFQAWLGQ